MKITLYFSFFLVFLVACKKDTKIEEVGPSTIKFVFDPTVNGQALVPVNKWYTNFSGDSFTVSKFNYYISNLRFRNVNGSTYSVPECYHLIRHIEGVNSFTVSNLPEGEYDQIDFIIGVDSLHNVSGSQSGDLDPALNMFWDWNTGYIFYKLEGQFNTHTQPLKTGYAMHVGGFSGKQNCIQSCSFGVNPRLQSKGGKTSTVFFKTRVEEVFQNPAYIDFDYYYANITNTILKQLSDNYRDMFLLDHVEN